MGVISHSEHLRQGRKDVLIYHQHQGLTIVLEGSYDKKDAEDDAKKRIEQLAADVAILPTSHRNWPKTKGVIPIDNLCGGICQGLPQGRGFHLSVLVVNSRSTH